MSDLESYVNHCYDLLLHKNESAEKQEDSELCACAKLVERDAAKA